MTNNFDEFEQEEAEQVASNTGADRGRGNLAEAWRTRPLFKLLVIMIVVGAAIAIALGVSGPSPSDTSRLVKASDLNEPPGGKASPYFNEQSKLAANERVASAVRDNGSAMPSPLGNTVDVSDLTNNEKTDPLKEFREETERLKRELKQEQQQNIQQMQAQQQQMQQPQQQFDDSLATAMQRQMSQLMDSWAPRDMKVVAFAPLSKDADGTGRGATTATAPVNNAAATAPAPQNQQVAKTIIPGGTVNYAQMLTEANSDVPGPILAQILSGPFAGARAVGRFQVMNDYLVIQFSLVNFKGKDYGITALALDPDTTLGGMATEVDHRYFDRVLLPAAGAFMSSFGQSLGQGNTTTTVTNNGILVEQAKNGYKDGLYAGLGKAGQTIGEFFDREAARTQPLVRVAAGTPLGLFFLDTVKDDNQGLQTNNNNNNGMFGFAQNYMQQGGYGAGGGYPTRSQPGYPPGYTGGLSAVPGYGPTYGAYGNNGYGGAAYPLGQSGSGVTIIQPGQSGLGTSYYGR